MNAAAGLVEVRVPDMGNFKDVAIIDVLVKPGEKIEPEAPLVTLETEKATMDVPSTVGGVVEKIHIAKGGTVSPGDLIVTVRSEAAEGAAPEGAGAGGSAGGAGTSGNGSAAGTSAAGDSPRGGALAGSLAGAGTSGSAGSPNAAGAAGTGRPIQATSGGAQAAGPEAGGPQGGAQAQGPQGAGPQAAGPQADFARTTPGGAAQGTSAGTTHGGASAAAQFASTPPQPGAGDAASASKPGIAAGGRTGSAAGQPGSATAGGPSVAASGLGQAGNGAGPIAGRLDLPPINEPGFSRAHAGPSVRRFARELGVDLTQVKGGGFKGRVTHDDVKAFVKKFLATGAKPAPAVAKSAPGTGAPSSFPTVPVIDFSLFGPIESKPLSRIQKISGPRLHASWVNIPHVTQFDEADITELEDVRTQLKQKALQAGIKLTPLAFIVRACVRALQEFPQLNSSLDPNGANLILKKYIHVGFAADTPNGLVVPVVHDANRKDIYEIAKQLGELSEKARAGKLSAAEMQGGSFTISSLGGIGGTAFTPIINAPEVAILGVSRSTMKPVFRDGAFVPRLILPLSLSYDHRVIDGASAARFTTFLAQTLADPRALTEAVP
jgi:pyruvate dehydrogenase E2 component (dihydrolipoamide acetyltransferase)